MNGLKSGTKVLFVFGTRPEAIKLVPLIKTLKEDASLTCKVCSTGQHKELLDQVLEFFNVIPDYDLELMEPQQSLVELTNKVITGVDSIVKNEFSPDYVIVQGDTTSAFSAALAAFYNLIKVIHIEAGYRSFDKYAPFPEELNRKFISNIADFHFTPTLDCLHNLVSEGINENVIWNVGNTVIDALLMGLNMINNNVLFYDDHFSFISNKKKVILVTGHRRENFGTPVKNICNAIKQIAENNPDFEIVYSLHLNPNSRKTVLDLLQNLPKVHLVEPLNYSKLIWLLSVCYLVITDSGGIQEEAATLGKPVLIIRHVTERMDGVSSGTAKLVGTDTKKIVDTCQNLIDDIDEYKKMSKAGSPYGDGTASLKILEIMKGNFVSSNLLKKLIING